MAEDPSPVVVDLGGLREIGAWLQHESHHLAQSVARDVHFGQHSPCGETNAARWALVTVLDGHTARADHHRHEIAAVAAALHEIVTRYDSADSAGADRLRGLGQ